MPRSTTMRPDWNKIFDEIKILGRFGSDAQLAEYLGLTRAQISAWRTGKSDLGILTKLKLLDALGHDSLRSVMLRIWPTRYGEELIRQHAALLARVGRVSSTSASQPISAEPHRVLPARSNCLIAALPSHERECLAQYLTPVFLHAGQNLYPHGAPDELYFPSTSIVAVAQLTAPGLPPEPLIIGKDGFVGVTIALGGHQLESRVFVQTPGYAFRLPRKAIVEDLAQCTHLRQLLFRCTQMLLACMAQTSMCHSSHTRAQQFCRWLLLSLDRTEDSQLAITSSLIAQVLDIPEGSVIEEAQRLHDARVIVFGSDSIELIDRAVLEMHACECYQRLKDLANKFARTIGGARNID